MMEPELTLRGTARYWERQLAGPPAPALQGLASLFDVSWQPLRATRVEIGVLSALVLLAAALRFWALGSIGLHGDEDIMALATLHIVKHEDRSVTRRQLLYRSFEIDPIHRAAQPQIGRADVLPGAAGLFIRLRSFLERSNREGLLAQPHQNHVDRHPVQPGRESRFSAEGADLAEQLQEGFLQQILGVRRITHHTQTEGVNAATMHLIKKVERRSVPGLRQADGFRFRERHRRFTARLFGLGWSVSGQRSSCGASKTSDAANPLSSCP